MTWGASLNPTQSVPHSLDRRPWLRRLSVGVSGAGGGGGDVSGSCFKQAVTKGQYPLRKIPENTIRPLYGFKYIRQLRGTHWAL